MNIHHKQKRNERDRYNSDRQSDVQKQVQKSIEQAGGRYIIVRTFEDFLNQV